ncbi:hypothetical protein BASA61_002839 [Batrachochytrium salamandrivorans]|nr:hypothetical protein BASA61_002839 [Batrachochytrium salamandrivorans]KAH9277173.1 hypothetical protein BASA83_000033 [Batrachochytrium salamandrivorans]
MNALLSTISSTLAAYSSVPYVTIPFFIVGFLALATYLLPCGLQALLPSQNLRQKYSASWALVTGGSSGIGASISERLASEGINVVIAALEDPLLKSSVDGLAKKYPKLQFRAVGVNLASKDFMTKIQDATNDIEIAMVFNNAGYIKPGLFTSSSIQGILANFDVNATCTLSITHHFMRKMQARGKRSLVCFTSSSGGLLPGPMSSIYSSTKAWMTNFAVSVAAEVAEDQIDVLVVHPSPIASNFYSNANGMTVLKAVEKSAQQPTVISDVIWKCAGRTTIVDQGAVSVGLKLLLKMLDWNFLSELMVAFVRTNGDYKMFKKAKQA